MKITDINNYSVSLEMGESVLLPQRVEVRLEGGIKTTFPVVWEEIDSTLLERPGTITVEGVVKNEEFPDPLVMNRADPYVLKHTDGYYYFTGSVPEYDRIILRRSRTICGLSNAEEIVIWTRHGEGEMGSHIWAPELHYIDGNWYLYFAAGRSDDKWAIRPYVLECIDDNPLTGRWMEKGRIKLPVESFSLDATTFKHREERYLVWAQIVEDSCLYIARMDTPWSIATEPVKISSPEYEWEIQRHRVNEGPAVLVKNGRVFMAYSASGTDDRYCMGLLTADETSNLLDPSSWTKSQEPVFISSESASQFGPGHNSFVMSNDDSEILFVYHARSYKEITGEPLYDPNRHARVQQLLWLPDGTPYFGEPGWTLETAGHTAKAKITVRGKNNSD